MRRYLLKRAVEGAITLFLTTIVIFGLIRISGDPVSFMADPEASGKDIAEVKARYGLDKPLIVQYRIFMSGVVRGDFGNSLRWKMPALELLAERVPNTLQLVGTALLLSIVGGVGLGAVAALRPEGVIDRVGKLVAVVGLAMPSFWFGILAILIFAVTLQWLPPAGGVVDGGPENLILPTLTLAHGITAAHFRITRSSMLQVLGSEYIKMARIKGLPQSVVLWKHALKNASIPVIALVSTNFAHFVTGTVITETVFAWPGIGQLLVNSVMMRDYAVVQTIVLFGAATIIVTYMIVDAGYAYLDPRIRYQ